MKLSSKGRYGLRAMVDLSVNSEQAAISLNSIAKRENISENYLEQIFAKMKSAGLVISQRGAGGGYRIGKPLKDISVGDILRALEGDLSLVSCTGLETIDGGAEGECETSDICVTKYVWSKVNLAINNTFDSISLEELATESKKVNIKNKKTI